jgi:hypothetical protein
MSDLKPGDLCVIVRSQYCTEREHALRCYGLMVILIDTVPSDGDLRPYWRCSGLPRKAFISHVCLRKIPPAPMELEPQDAEVPEWTTRKMARRFLAGFERDAYERRMLRGPMIKPDIDWRAPMPYREMLDSDIGWSEVVT